jgi:ribose/xylose/arabinose/galactoside ABC-type transport system permease subunit
VSHRHGLDLLLLIVLIVTLIAVMTILEPTTFPGAANAAAVLLDTAQTGILACGMMVL